MLTISYYLYYFTYYILLLVINIVSIIVKVGQLSHTTNTYYKKIRTLGQSDQPRTYYDFLSHWCIRMYKAQNGLFTTNVHRSAYIELPHVVLMPNSIPSPASYAVVVPALRAVSEFGCCAMSPLPQARWPTPRRR